MSDFVEVKTAKLTGSALDWAVASATGEVLSGESIQADHILVGAGVDGDLQRKFSPSTDWSQGGPLIDKYQLTVSSPKSPVHRNGGPLGGWNESGSWTACTWERGVTGKRAVAWDKESPLVAACRAIVAAKLGDVVRVPKDLITEAV